MAMTSAVDAKAVARQLLEDLGSACEQIMVAGSLRRGALEVKDVELVAVPRRATDLLGTPNGPCQLTAKLRELACAGKVRWRGETHPTTGTPFLEELRAWFLVALPSGVRVDLFAVRPPAQFGCILAIRTGPAEYSRQLVTVCQRRGLRCKNGRLLNARGEPVSTPTERSFIEACGMRWQEPRHRGVR